MVYDFLSLTVSLILNGQVTNANGQGVCVPGSFCTNRNASSVEFLETRLILGSEANC